MPNWSKITKEQLDTELALAQPDAPDFTTSRPITATEVRGSLDVTWPSKKTMRVMEARLFGDSILGRRQLRSGIWTPLLPLEPYWWINRAASAIVEPRLLDLAVGTSAPLFNLTPPECSMLLLFRTDNGIFALGYGMDDGFYAQYS